MVYRGKPSKGCGECRSRKIKCDQVRPVCSQCIRANRDCPGYRDQLSLMFRDESQDVVRRATAAVTDCKSRRPRKASKNFRAGSSSETSSQSEGEVVPMNADSLDFSIGQQQAQFQLIQQSSLSSLALPQPTLVRDEAVCFLIHNKSLSLPNSIFSMEDEMTGLVPSPANSFGRQAMMASVTSVGMAMLSRVTKSASMKVEAGREYGAALKLVNLALLDDVEARTHSVLAAVILLAVFEIATCRKPQDLEGWTNHVRGTTALLELRGTEDLHSQLGMSLFRQARHQIIVSCLQKSIHVPALIAKFTDNSDLARPQASMHSEAILQISADLANLRADIKQKILCGDVEIFSAASAIDARLHKWVATLPGYFAYTVVDLSSAGSWPSGSRTGVTPYKGQCHVYSELWVCVLWNYYRGARILVGDIIMDCLKRFSAKSCPVSPCPSNDEFLSRSRSVHATLRQYAVDICHSIPAYFCADGTDNSPQKLPILVPGSAGHTGGLSLLWPLTLAAMVEDTGHPIRKYVVGILKQIRKTTGVDQALALVDMLENDLVYL